MKKMYRVSDDERQQIILSFLQKMQGICKDNSSRTSCLECLLWLKEAPLGIEGDCMKRRIGDLSDKQLSTLIEKVLEE